MTLNHSLHSNFTDPDSHLENEKKPLKKVKHCAGIRLRGLWTTQDAEPDELNASPQLCRFVSSDLRHENPFLLKTVNISSIHPSHFLHHVAVCSDVTSTLLAVELQIPRTPVLPFTPTLLSFRALGSLSSMHFLRLCPSDRFPDWCDQDLIRGSSGL